MKLLKRSNNGSKKSKLVAVKKPKLIKSSSKERYTTEDILDIYSGKFRGNFPFRPQMKNKKIITTIEELKDLGEKLKVVDAFAYDTETNTLKVQGDNKDFKLVDITISWGEHNNYDIPIGHVREEDIDKQLPLETVIKYLKEGFEREDVLIIGANIKYDLHVMERVGIHVKTQNLFDVNLASWLCDENSPNDLKTNAIEKLGVDPSKFKDIIKEVPKEVKKSFGLKANQKATFDLVTIEDGHQYALDDSFNTWFLYLGFVKELEKEGMDKIYYRMFIPFLITLYRMEERGITVDVPKLKQMGVDMQVDLDRLTYQIYELAGVEFNMSSSQQKAEILFGYRKEPTLIEHPSKYLPKGVFSMYTDYLHGDRSVRSKLEDKGYKVDGRAIYKTSKCNEHIIDKNFGFKMQKVTKAGAPSTDSDTIERLSKQKFVNKRKKQGVLMCKYLMEYSKLSKLKTAFVDGLLEQMYDDGKAHPNFKQTGTDSGRISASQPNLQQLPNASDEDKYQIRDCFISGKYDEQGKRYDIISVD